MELIQVDKNELGAYHKIRYEIFCKELSRVSSQVEDFETDKYDDYSLHFWICSEGKKVGLVRIILPNQSGLNTQERYSVLEYETSDRENSAEISRLAFLSEYRNNLVFSSTKIVDLFERLLDECKKYNVEYVFIAVIPRFARLLNNSGIKFEPISPLNLEVSPARQVFVHKINRANT